MSTGMGFFSKSAPRVERVRPPPFRLLDLPVEILLQLLEACDISSMHNLRRTSRTLHSFIDTNIHFIAPAVARTTFPSAPQRLLEFEGATHDLAWLDEVRLRWMAAVLVEHPMSNCTGRPGNIDWAVPAEDPAGREARASVTEGLRVLRQLHLISRRINDYDDLPDTEPVLLKTTSGILRTFRLAKTLLRDAPSKNTAPFHLDRLAKREEKIVHYRLKYLATVSLSDLIDFNTLILLLACCGGATRHPHPGVHLYDVDAIDGGYTEDARHFTKGRSWLSWFVMHRGPAMFLHQWLSAKGSDKSTWIQQQCHAAIAGRSIQQINMERDAGQRVGKAIALRWWGGTTLNSRRDLSLAQKTVEEERISCFADVPFRACFGTFEIAEDRVLWFREDAWEQARQELLRWT